MIHGREQPEMPRRTSKDLTWVCTNPLCRARGATVLSPAGGGGALVCDDCGHLLWDLSRSKGQRYRGNVILTRRDTVVSRGPWWVAVRDAKTGAISSLTNGKTELLAAIKVKCFVDGLHRAPPRKRYGSRVAETITDSYMFSYQGGTIYVDRESESPEFWRARAYDDDRYIWHAMGGTMKEAKEGAQKIIDAEIARCQRRHAW